MLTSLEIWPNRSLLSKDLVAGTSLAMLDIQFLFGNLGPFFFFTNVLRMDWSDEQSV